MSTLAEIHARCLAEKLGPSACAELVEPLCEGRGVLIEFGKPPRCVGGELSPQKAAVLLAEAEARKVTPFPWPLAIVGALGLGLIVWAVAAD